MINQVFGFCLLGLGVAFWLARHMILLVGVAAGYSIGIAQWTASELIWWRRDVQRARAQMRAARRTRGL